MLTDARLARVAGHEIRMRHLLVAGILAAAFTVSFLVRSQPAEWGYELNEFDPFFNLRAAQYIVDNGLGAYLDWHDTMSWYPEGRDISKTGQAMQHITAAYLYQAFGGGSTLYDFAIMIPVVFGSLTAIVAFALVRVVAGTTAGLFASLFFALSVPVIVRGTIGWFKAEPLGLFYGMLGVYLFLSGIRSADRRIAAAKLAGAGIMIAFGLSAWGGVQFFTIMLGMFFLALPLVRRDHGFLAWSVPLFVAALFVASLGFERPGLRFLLGAGGMLTLGPAAYVVASSLIQRFSPEAARMRNGLLFLGGTLGAGIAVLLANFSVQFLPVPSFRYLNAVNPFLTTTSPLVDSVAEHATTTTGQSFFFLSILMVFAGLGAWLILANRDKLRGRMVQVRPDMAAFALITGMFGAYISSAFVRLELFASFAVIMLASIALAMVSSGVLRAPPAGAPRPGGRKRAPRPASVALKASYVSAIVGLLLVPTMLPIQGNWVDSVATPPSILNGGTGFGIANQDWLESLEWLRTSTSEDAVVAAWWDYGYWISTMAERASLADNGTLSGDRIREIARMLLDDPDGAWERLNAFGADYVLIFIAANKIQHEPVPAYLLTGGGDESKKQWFMRIAADDPVSTYLHADGFSGTAHFWDRTALGGMIPYSVLTYVDFQTNEQSPAYRDGYTAVYSQDLKYPPDGDGPLRLAYASDSFYRESPGPVTAVLIYEVNPDYVPAGERPAADPSGAPSGSAVVATALGEFTIALREDLAPDTVANFRDLAESGFYDGTVFHRIVPGFVIQGGDPNTVAGQRHTWGQGGPGYSIGPEFSDEQHVQYKVSMARGAAVDSAGSQFFVVLGNATFLDGQYTIFGEVTDGTDVVDRLSQVELDPFFAEQPRDPSQVMVESVRIAG